MPHTPGPWTYAYEGSGSHNVYDLAKDDLVASCLGDKGFDESMANALLVAAAPEMYALLKKFHQMLKADEAIGYETVNVHTRRSVLPELAAVLKAVEGE